MFNTPPIYILLAGLVAALITGLFSYINLVSAKENKVSELRLVWLDGLREEVASYTAAIQDMVRFEQHHNDWMKRGLNSEFMEERNMKWLVETSEPCFKVVSAYTKIQLRLNPNHVTNTTWIDGQLMEALKASRKAFDNKEYGEAMNKCSDVIAKTAPILKSTWNEIKNGEIRFRRVRLLAEIVIPLGFIYAGYLITKSL